MALTEVYCLVNRARGMEVTDTHTTTHAHPHTNTRCVCLLNHYTISWDVDRHSSGTLELPVIDVVIL